MKKIEKSFFVENLAKIISSAKSIILVDYQGLSVNKQEELRNLVKATGGKFMVVKNSLLAKALKKGNIADIGLGLKDFQGSPTACLIATEDEISPLQALGKFISEFNAPKLKIGIVGGKIQSESKLLEFSKLPAKEVLQTKVLGSLFTPLFNLVNLLNLNLSNLVLILDSYSKKKGGEIN